MPYLRQSFGRKIIRGCHGQETVYYWGIAAGLILVYVAGGFWAIPASTNWALKKYVDPLIDREVTTEKVEFNPFTLHLNVKGLNVQKSGTPTPFSASKKSIQSSNGAHFSSLLRWFSILKLTSFKPTSFITGLATFNFSTLLINLLISPEEPKEEDKDKKTQKFSIDNFEIINSGG